MQRLKGSLCAALVLVGSFDAAPLAADPITEAVKILDANRGTVRKWAYTPRVVVVHDRTVNTAAFEETIAHINEATGLGIAQPTYLDLSGAVLSDRFYRETTVLPSKRENGQIELTVTIAAEKDYVERGDLIVYMMTAPYASHLLVASGYGRVLQSLERWYTRGPGYCFFDIRANDESIQGGRIFISSETEPAYQARCIYEELTQSMGLIDDAKGSEVFTYDNEAIDKPRDHDKALLAALYHPSVKFGDPVAKVIVLYDRSAPR